MGACSSGPVMRNATGFAYEIVVTMDKADWDAPAGKAIKAELTSDIPGLPQAEPAFKITYVTPDQFNGLLTYVRNVLIVRIDKSGEATFAQGNVIFYADGSVILLELSFLIVV